MCDINLPRFRLSLKSHMNLMIAVGSTRFVLSLVCIHVNVYILKKALVCAIYLYETVYLVEILLCIKRLNDEYLNHQFQKYEK